MQGGKHLRARSAAARSPLTPIPHVLTFQTGGATLDAATRSAPTRRRKPPPARDGFQRMFVNLGSLMRSPYTLTVVGAGHTAITQTGHEPAGQAVLKKGPDPAACLPQ